MDLGYSSHAFHSSSRLVFMEATLASDGQCLTFQSPPNNRVFPPGPGTLSFYPSYFFLPCWFFFYIYLLAFIFFTIDGVTSEGSQVLVGNGGAPPVSDQGVPIPAFRWNTPKRGLIVFVIYFFSGEFLNMVDDIIYRGSKYFILSMLHTLRNKPNE